MKKYTDKFHLYVQIFLISTRLGLTSFGGPSAHIGYFYEEYVRKRKWLDEKGYADLVALAQFLPGPASSQIGIGIGVIRGGLVGGLVSFIGFTWPSVIALILFATLFTAYDVGSAGWIHGLKIVAVVVVAHAIMGMAQTLTKDSKEKMIALFALIVSLIWSTSFTQITIILVAAFIGFLLFKQRDSTIDPVIKIPISKQIARISLVLFFSLLVLLPILKEATGSYWVAIFDQFYRTGAFVFGGGHVVLPLLEQEFVASGWVSKEAFLAGYGVTQAVPGPLFTFAAYLGAVMQGWLGGVVATIAIFLPAFLLMIGALPFWHQLSQNRSIRGAIIGVNAAVVGLLIAALYDSIWTSAILSPIDFALAALLYSMLVFWKLSPWVVVMGGAIAGLLMQYV